MPYYWVPTDLNALVVNLPTLAKIARESWVSTTELATDVTYGGRAERRVYYVPYFVADMLEMISHWINTHSLPPDVVLSANETTGTWDALDKLYIAPAIEMSRAEGPEEAPRIRERWWRPPVCKEELKQ